MKYKNNKLFIFKSSYLKESYQSSQYKNMQGRQRSRSRQKKREIRLQAQVRNLPQHVNKQDLSHYLWKTLQSCRGLIKPGNPIIQSFHVQEGNYIKLILRSFEETENCLFLDRLYYGRKVLSIRSSFVQVPSFTKMNVSKLKRVSHKTQDQFKKIYVGNLPYMPEYQMMNLLSQYGQLRSFINISKDKSMSQCFCEYVSDQSTDEALVKLNSLKLKGRPVIVKRAALMNTAQTSKTKVTSKVIASNLPSNRFEKDLNEFYTTFDSVGYFKNKNISCVLCLRNIIPPNCNVEGIIADVKKQIQKVGPLVKITSKGLNIYIEYEKVQYSQIAYIVLQNRKYDGKQVQVSFYDPIKFADDVLI